MVANLPHGPQLFSKFLVGPCLEGSPSLSKSQATRGCPFYHYYCPTQTLFLNVWRKEDHNCFFWHSCRECLWQFVLFCSPASFFPHLPVLYFFSMSDRRTLLSLCLLLCHESLTALCAYIDTNEIFRTLQSLLGCLGPAFCAASLSHGRVLSRVEDLPHESVLL